MEALSRQLQPHKELVGSLASVVTIAQFFSGIFICATIYKKRSTKGIAAVPFIGGVVLGILVLKYALILEDKAMFQVNVAAIILNILYVGFYHVYSENKWEEVYKPFAVGTAIVAVIFGYLGIEDPKEIEFRYGLIVTVLSLSLLGSPLLELNEMIKKKDASSIPFPLVFMGTIVSFLWLLYGIILLNEFMVLQNTIGLALCIVQLALYFMYPGSGEDSKSESGSPKKKED